MLTFHLPKAETEAQRGSVTGFRLYSWEVGPQRSVHAMQPVFGNLSVQKSLP